MRNRVNLKLPSCVENIVGAHCKGKDAAATAVVSRAEANFSVTVDTGKAIATAVSELRQLHIIYINCV